MLFVLLAIKEFFCAAVLTYYITYLLSIQSSYLVPIDKSLQSLKKFSLHPVNFIVLFLSTLTICFNVTFLRQVLKV